MILRIILNCFNPGHFWPRPGLTNEDQLPTTHCAGFYWSLIQGHRSTYYKWANLGSGISCCPVQVGMTLALAYHIGSLACTCTIAVKIPQSQHLIPDPRASIDLLQVSQPWIRDQQASWLLSRIPISPADPRSDAHDCCRVLHRIRDQFWWCEFKMRVKKQHNQKLSH